jgi:hypothetical protein
VNIDFEHALNEEQLAAVQAPDGPVLIIAAAGTGKTRTLTYRVAWLVERGIDPLGQRGHEDVRHELARLQHGNRLPVGLRVDVEVFQR